MRLLLLLLLLVGCGTETGNPITPSSPASGEDGTTTSTEGILEKVCEKIESCYSVKESTCKTNTLEEDGFDDAFDIADYDDLQAIVDAETAGDLSVTSTSAVTQCKTDIENLSCSDSEVVNAYSTSSPNDYSNMADIIPTNAGSCQDIF